MYAQNKLVMLMRANAFAHESMNDSLGNASSETWLEVHSAFRRVNRAYIRELRHAQRIPGMVAEAKATCGACLVRK